MLQCLASFLTFPQGYHTPWPLAWSYLRLMVEWATGTQWNAGNAALSNRPWSSILTLRMEITSPWCSGYTSFTSWCHHVLDHKRKTHSQCQYQCACVYPWHRCTKTLVVRSPNESMDTENSGRRSTYPPEQPKNCGGRSTVLGKKKRTFNKF